MRSIILALVVAIAAVAPSSAADAPTADPVLAEATDLAGYVMFAEFWRPRHGSGDCARRQ